VTVSDDSVTAVLNRKGKTLYCHLINKDRRESGFAAHSGFKVTVALPADLQLSDASAVYVSPDISGGAPALLQGTLRDNAIEITVPALEIYGVVVIPSTGYSQ
jgi:hypothetical protein